MKCFRVEEVLHGTCYCFDFAYAKSYASVKRTCVYRRMLKNKLFDSVLIITEVS